VGGTTLSVLSPYRAERVGPIVEAQLIAEGLTRRSGSGSGYSGSWDSAEGRPYGYDVQAPDLETEPEELRLVEEAAGKRIRCDILLHIYVSDIAGRPALGRIAGQVARWTEGWVHVEFADPPPAALLSRLAGAGCCLPLEYAAYLDAAAMGAWLADPDFHVLK
jgi:hypothetical protein